MMTALQVYKTMLDEGLMSKEFTTNNGNNLAQFVYSPKVGTVQLGSSALLSVNKKLKAAVPEGEYINALSPVGPDGKGGPMVGSPVSFVMLINNKVPQDKAAAIVKFFDWMQTEEGDKFFTYGLEGTDFTMDNGKINYKFPQTPEEINREEFHQHILWFINDKSIFKREYMNPEAKPVIDFVTKELVKEGRSTISFDPPLESSTQNPDVGADSPFILEHITKMIYGKEPISDWPKVIEEWKKKGGDAVIKEATDRYNKKQGVYMPIR
jgi:putative aldouronate transport system substrate-binding protein